MLVGSDGLEVGGIVVRFLAYIESYPFLLYHV